MKLLAKLSSEYERRFGCFLHSVDQLGVSFYIALLVLKNNAQFAAGSPSEKNDLREDLQSEDYNAIISLTKQERTS